MRQNAVMIYIFYNYVSELKVLIVENIYIITSSPCFETQVKK
jgi:hypothetical protein